MPVNHPALVEHIRQLSAQAEALRLLIEPAPPPRRPRWPWAVIAVLVCAGCAAGWRLMQPPAGPAIVAPISPTGPDARDLYTRP